MILTIDQNPSIADQILFTFTTKDVNNKTIDPYKVNSLKIYFIERDFASTYNKEYSADAYYNHDYIQGEIHKGTTLGNGQGEQVIKFITEHSPIVKGTLNGTIFRGSNIVNTFTVDKKDRFILTDIKTGGISPAFKVNCGSINLDTGEVSLTWNRDPSNYKIIINYEYKMPNGNDFFYYKEATPVEMLGSELFPAWLSTDQEKTLIVKDDCSEGFFNYTWDPSGRREGDYFICYTWTPYAGASALSSHEKFYLNGSTLLNTSIPSHQTVAGKYEELLERYLPEMFKTLISDDDRTPDVLDNFNKSVAKGFTFLEDLTNQMVDLFDANVINESLLSYLGNTLDLKFKSSDPTLWRRQIKEAVPLFKKKGSMQAMRESFSQAGMKLLRLVNHWQIKSPYFYIDSFFYNPEMKGSFTLTKIILNHVGGERDYLPKAFLLKSISKNEIELDFNESFRISQDNPLQLTWKSNQYVLGMDDIVRVEYYYKEPANEKERNLEKYIKSLPLADDRDEYNILKDSQVFRQYPLKNWNVRLIREDDPFIGLILVEHHPFHEDLIFGKIRTEFPYSENVYNMEEYNGSTRDSKNPCDIDKDFIDPCSYCRSGKFDVDLEIERLSSDRLLEVKDIITENAPFHSVLKTINIFGNNSEFVTPPVEEYEILITHNYLESSIAGGENIFNRNKFMENIVGRSDLTTKSFVKTSVINFYNKEKVLFCPDINFGSLSIGSDCYVEVLSPHGVYGVSGGNKNQININNKKDILVEPINNSPFIFDIYNEIFQSMASLEREDVIELEDQSVNFKNLDDMQRVKIVINGTDHYLDIIKVMSPDMLLLRNNDLIISDNLSSNYRVLNSLSQEILLKGTSKLSRCDIKYTNNSKVTLSEDMLDKKILKNYNNFLSFTNNSTNHLCKITLIQDNYVYITGYNGSNLGGVQVKFRQNLAEKKSGYFGYNGILAKTNGNLKTELSIRNEDEETNSSDSFKEDYALYVNSNGNYYFISEVDYNSDTNTTIMNLSGVFDNFGTDSTNGIQNNVSIYKYTKNISEIVDDYTMKEEVLKIGRKSNEIIEKSEQQSLSVQSNSKNGPTDFSEQNESIQIVITNLDGTKERKEL
jgi:hypothetical protein